MCESLPNSSASFNTETVSVLQKLNAHSSDVISCDFGCGCYLATGSGDKSVCVYEWKQGLGFVETSYSPLVGHKYSVTCVRFSPLLPILASASVDGHTNLWSLRTGHCLHSLVQANGNGVRTVCFSKKDNLLASAGEGGTLCVWSINASNYSLIKTINGHDDESIQGSAFSPDGLLLVTGDMTGSYKIWSTLAAKEDIDPALITIRDAHDLGINSLEFSNQYTVHMAEESSLIERTYIMVSSGNDHFVRVWQVSTSQSGKNTSLLLPPSPPVLLAKLQGHHSAVTQIRISTDGELIASTSIDKTTRIWQLSTNRCLKTLDGHSRYVTSCAFSSDQSLLVTGSNDRTVIVWDLTGALGLDSELSQFPTFNSQLVPNSESLQDESHNERSMQLLHKMDVHSASINSVDFNEDYFVTAGTDHRIMIWKWSGLDELRLVHDIEEAHRYSIHQIEFCHKTGLLASCSLDGTAILWDPETGTPRKSGFHVSGSGVKCVRFSPDSNYLAAGGDDDIIQIYDTETLQNVGNFVGDGEGVTCLAFSPQSDYILSGSADGHCRLYHLASTASNPVYTLDDAHDLGVTSMDFSEVPHAQYSGDRGGKYEVATCGNDCLIKVWKVKAQENRIILVWTLKGHGGSVTCVRYSPKLSEMIASTGTDKTCRLWDAYSGECRYLVESHDGILTCCAFSPDATLLATGSLDKSVLIWELPKDLAFHSFLAAGAKHSQNIVAKWTVDNVNKWLEIYNIAPSNLTGLAILQISIPKILDQLNIDDEAQRAELAARLEDLRKEVNGVEPPHEFLCPITHQLMRDPVIATDGYSYERSAIEAWFLNGHSTSPMTNNCLTTTNLEPNIELRQAISTYLTHGCIG
ncbi:WD repeat, SAM and U-box domain-containing protein 1-like isoform X2 [Rhodnius prolixus]|uniref:WD repeat, SAM and U-box domain-containing protein 1-like isoform X2 n=1 Tax=Rhodnius prolixus TaxID=13249 RepID=UPI003D187B25